MSAFERLYFDTNIFVVLIEESWPIRPDEPTLSSILQSLAA